MVMMKCLPPSCAWALALAASFLSAPLFAAEEPGRYRDFQLGSTLEAVARLTSAPVSEAKVVHERPVPMKDLEWRPRYFSQAASRLTDPVDQIVFRFFDDQLFQVIVDYDPRRTEGMTESDMIEGVTAAYGPVMMPLPRAGRATDLLYGAPDSPIAVWGGTDHSVTLMRVAYPKAFRLVVASTGLQKLARAASAEALRLDAREAPLREIARLKKEADDATAAHAKAKSENKAIFRP